MADVSKEEETEFEVLSRELQWLLDEQVSEVLEDINNTLLECSRRFPLKTGCDGISGMSLESISEGRGEESLIKPHKILLTSPNSTGISKCVVTMLADNIYEADINFKHKQGKDHHVFKTSINPTSQWKIQQVQDAGNHLLGAMNVMNRRDKNHVFSSSREVLLLLEELMSCIRNGRTSLAFPKRKSIEDLIISRNTESFQPPVPNDVTLSFYIHASKLVLALYHLHINGTQKPEITSRQQVECTVQWLNEAIMFFTYALQQCQQLKDKIQFLVPFEKQDLSLR